MENLDETDLKILDVLKENSNLSTSKISKKTGIPVTTVFNRIKKLERNGIIKKYTVVLDTKKLGYGLVCYIFMHYDITIWDKGVTREQLKKQLLSLSNVEEISYVSGRFDVFLKARLRNMDDLNELILSRLRKIPGISQTESFFVLEEIK